MKNILLSALIFLACGAQAQIITTIAGNDSVNYCCDGSLAIHAGIYRPTDVAVDAAGTIYIADGGNNRIRKITTSGIITTIAGIGGADGYNGDEIPATNAKLAYPSSLILDAAGNIYFCDDHNYRIRKISVAGIITTIVGIGTSGYNGDNIPATAAQITAAGGIIIDNSLNVYISDIDNNRIRKISSADNIITTIAGTGIAGYSGDGGSAVDAELFNPTGIALNNSGDIYVTEHGNHCVRKISTTGLISTVAGNGVSGYNGDNIPATSAQLGWPHGIKIDSWGNLYISDVISNRIRKINSTSGYITTIAGSGITGYSGDDGPATLAQFKNPHSITISIGGDIYIADWGNNRIRYINNALSMNSVIEEALRIKTYPNPSIDGRFTLNITSTVDEIVNTVIINSAGQKIKEFTEMTNTPIDVKLDALAGCYIVFVYNEHNKYSTIVSVVK